MSAREKAVATQPSVLEQLKKLDEQRAKLIDGAKQEALNTAVEAIKALNDLGFEYQLVLGQPTAPKVSKTGITRKRADDAQCDVCNFVTSPTHDGRKHRSQGDNKKPFTAKELAELGLTKV
jgi:hypothetical protein